MWTRHPRDKGGRILGLASFLKNSNLGPGARLKNAAWLFKRRARSASLLASLYKDASGQDLAMPTDKHTLTTHSSKAAVCCDGWHGSKMRSLAFQDGRVFLSPKYELHLISIATGVNMWTRHPRQNQAAPQRTRHKAHVFRDRGHVTLKSLPREGPPRCGLACFMLVQIFCVLHDVRSLLGYFAQIKLQLLHCAKSKETAAAIVGPAKQEREAKPSVIPK